MGNQLNIFFLLFGAVQGALVSFFLLKNVRRDKSQIYLMLFLSVAGLQLTFKVIAKTWLTANVGLLYNLSYSLPYLAGPLLYWFVSARLDNKMFRPIHLLHFLPFLISAVSIVRAFIAGSPYVDSFTVWLLRDYTAAIIQMIVLIVFAVLAWKVIRSTSLSIKSGMKQFVILVVICEAVIIITLYLMHRYYGSFPDVRLLFLALTFLMYWISYKLIAQPELFIPVTTATPVAQLRVEPPSAKYAHSGLKQEDADRIVVLLTEAMNQSRLYLESDLTIDTLATSLNISRHHLSQVLNERFQKSYFDYLNGFRVQEARNRLADRKYAHYTIAAIALDSGFSSVSSFNEAFKKHFNITPSKFRAQARKQMSA